MKTMLSTISAFILIGLSSGQVTNKVLVLDGDDDFMITGGTVLNDLQAVTVSVWLNSGSGGAILSTHFHGVSWESVELLSQWFIINSSDDMSTRQRVSYPVVADYTWHHLAAVWDGSEMRLYLDGIAFGDSIDAPNPPWNSPAAIVVGARASVSEPPATSELKAKIDELRVWNVARTQTQIKANMHTILGPEYYNTPDSGLIAYWRFDSLENLGIGDDGADDIRDYSVNQLHGDLNGDATIDTGGVALGLVHDHQYSPRSNRLFQNYPNPFNPETVISWQLAIGGHVELSVYNLLGEKVATLVSQRMNAGHHSYRFDGRKFSSGLYYYSLVAGTYRNVRKMILLH